MAIIKLEYSDTKNYSYLVQINDNEPRTNVTLYDAKDTDVIIITSFPDPFTDPKHNIPKTVTLPVGKFAENSSINRYSFSISTLKTVENGINFYTPQVQSLRVTQASRIVYLTPENHPEYNTYFYKTTCPGNVDAKTLDIYNVVSKSCDITVAGVDFPPPGSATSPSFEVYPICTIVDLIVIPEQRQVIATSRPGHTFAKCKEVAIQSGKNREIKEQQ